MVSADPSAGVILGEEVIQMKNESLVCPNKEVVNAENKCAAFLSIVVPGLGQIYKGHVVAGLLWMFLGMPIAVWTGILLGLATAGVGLLFPLMCWAGLALDAYYEKDLRIHHWFPPRDCQAT